MIFTFFRKDREVLLSPVLLLEIRKKRNKQQKQQLMLATQGEQVALQGLGGSEPAVMLMAIWDGSDFVTKREEVAPKT